MADRVCMCAYNIDTPTKESLKHNVFVEVNNEHVCACPIQWRQTTIIFPRYTYWIYNGVVVRADLVLGVK